MDSSETTLQTLFKYIDDHKNQFIEDLKVAVSIPSVSAFPQFRDDVIKMVNRVADQLTHLGATVELHDTGFQKQSDGTQIKLPPIILGTLGNDSQKPTILLYGHLDVQPASKSDGWDTEPFELILKDDKLYGRGSTDDKGPAISWLHVVEAHQKTNIPLPVNLKFCYEGMEESGSEGLDELLFAKKDTFLSDVDYVCISDNYWLGTKKPCLTYGLRGICTFFIEVTCASKDLHSGVFGGTVNEGMTDLIAMLNTLLDKNGQILVPGIMNDVLPLTDEEKELYSNIDFDVQAFKNEIGVTELLQSKKEELLMARWRYPCLSIHGIEGAFSETGMKCVIPRKVIGKFSIRLVPNQDPAKITKLVVDYLNEQWKARGSPNNMKAYGEHGAPAWRSDPMHPHFKAAAKAVRRVYKTDPDLTREGGSIPVALTFEEITGKNVLLLPMGRSDDGAHSQNEKIDVDNFIDGTKVMAAYLHEVGLSGRVKA